MFRPENDFIRTTDLQLAKLGRVSCVPFVARLDIAILMLLKLFNLSTKTSNYTADFFFLFLSLCLCCCAVFQEKLIQETYAWSILLDDELQAEYVLPAQSQFLTQFFLFVAPCNFCGLLKVPWTLLVHLSS